MPTNKVIASALAGVIVYALTKLAISIDPVVEQAINVGAMLIVAYLVPNAPTPGGYPNAAHQPVGVASDDALSDEAKRKLA